jgi:hypothetical protein
MTGTCKEAPTSLACWTSHVSMSRHLQRFRCRDAALAAADVHLTLFFFIQRLIFATFVTIRHNNPKVRCHHAVFHCAHCAAAPFALTSHTPPRSHSALLRDSRFSKCGSMLSHAPAGSDCVSRCTAYRRENGTAFSSFFKTILARMLCNTVQWLSVTATNCGPTRCK